MKKHFIYCLVIIVASLFIACVDESLKDTADAEEFSQFGFPKTTTILKERDASNPWKPTEYVSKFNSNQRSVSMSTSYPPTPTRNFLGLSFKTVHYPVEDTRNLGHEVVDFKELYRDEPNYYRAWKTKNGHAGFYSYSNHYRYQLKSSTTTTVEENAGLDLGVFSFGSKNKMTEVFSKTVVDNRDAVFGELNILVRDSTYRLQTSSNIKKKILKNYLTKDFKEELYKTPISEFYNNYGQFVLTEYTTGGRATALFSGLYKTLTADETKEHNMDGEIDAAYDFDFDDITAKGTAKLGRAEKEDAATSITNEFSSIRMAVQTIGGSSEFAAFSIPKEVKNTYIDLSKWVSSLNEAKNQEIIEFGNESLIPITEFIPEVNFKRIIESYIITGEKIEISPYQEPYILIETMPNGPGLFGIGASLVTRHKVPNIGLHEARYRNLDKILIAYGHIFQNQSGYVVFKEMVDKYSKIFGLEVRTEGWMKIQNARMSANKPPINHPHYYWSSDNMSKVIHNGTIYLISDFLHTDAESKQQYRMGFSIHYDALLDEYGLRDYVNSLPTKDISLEDLFSNKYQLYAL